MIFFAEVQRKPSKKENAKDANLIPFKTIFDNRIFEETLNRSVCKYLFVYSLARDAFKKELSKHFANVPCHEVQKRTDDNIPEIHEVTIDRKTIFLIYAPIHGRIKKKSKQEALKEAFQQSWKQ